MKGKHWCLLAIVVILSLMAMACGSTPTPVPTATPSPVPAIDTPVPPTDAPTAASVLPTPTLTPTRPSAAPSAEITTLPLPWPLTMPTGRQVREARGCDVEALTDERYSGVTTDELRESYPVVTSCDWAILAAAYALRAEADESARGTGQLAWANAVSQNPAYAFTEALFFGYLDAPDAVAPPPFTQDPLTGITIQYDWVGLGSDRVEYRITIENADAAPEVTGTVDGQDYSSALDEELAQALGQALTGLLPVAAADYESLVVCVDNYPDWQAILTYRNGETVEMATHGSNVYDLGGPWWVTVDDQLYLQPSPNILIALGDIVTTLELPIGQPAGMACFGLQSSVLDIFYPGY
jgi:hypothetical protein